MHKFLKRKSIDTIKILHLGTPLIYTICMCICIYVYRISSLELSALNFRIYKLIYNSVSSLLLVLVVGEVLADISSTHVRLEFPLPLRRGCSPLLCFSSVSSAGLDDFIPFKTSSFLEMCSGTNVAVTDLKKL